MACGSPFSTLPQSPATAPSIQMTISQQRNKTNSPDPFQERVLCVKLLQEEDLRPLCFTLHFSLQAGRVSAGEEPREGGDLGVQDTGLFSASEGRTDSHACTPRCCCLTAEPDCTPKVIYLTHKQTSCQYGLLHQPRASAVLLDAAYLE